MKIAKTTRKEYHHVFNKLKRQPITENLIELKKLKAKFRRTVKESRKKSWETYVSSIIHHTPTKGMWEKSNQIKGKRTCLDIPFLEIDQEITKPIDTAYTIASKFMSDTSTSIQSPSPSTINQEKSPKNNLQDFRRWQLRLYSIITIEEIENTLLAIKNSAPSLDNIPNMLLKQLPKSRINHLLKICI